MSVGASNGRVEITLMKLNAGRHWSSLGDVGDRDNSWLKTSTESEGLVFHCVTSLDLDFSTVVARIGLEIEILHSGYE